MADPKNRFIDIFTVNIGLHFVQHQPTIFSPTYDIKYHRQVDNIKFLFFHDAYQGEAQIYRNPCYHIYITLHLITVMYLMDKFIFRIEFL